MDELIERASVELSTTGEKTICENWLIEPLAT
jgi:hypothetical protein